MSLVERLTSSWLIMMHAVEMYMVIAVTLMTTTLGLLLVDENCLHYCNVSSEYSSIPPECNCSLHNLWNTRSTKSKPHIASPADIKDSIYYEPAELNSSQNRTFEEHFLHMFNHKHLIANTRKSFAAQDSYDENHSKTTKKYKRRGRYFPMTEEDTKGHPLHLYLDLDLNTSKNSNSSQIEELKKMIENFQAVEKDLSECLNLHIYIFSKYIDTKTKTNTNWGHNAQNDNLSNSQELTEIQSKCEQPVSIIKQSIYQVKQVNSRKEPAAEIIHRVESNTGKQTTTYNSENKLNVTAKSETFTTPATYPTDDVPSETIESNADETYDVELNLLNNELSGIKTEFTSTTPLYDHSTVYNDVASLTGSTSVIDYEDLRAPSRTDRTLFREEDMIIPRIITKEFSNGTLTSVVEGYEEIPNSDFVTNTMTSTASSDSVMSNSEEIVESDLVEIQGNLYFAFGKNQIPARFIQQADGVLNVAIDGFSMCSHMLRKNTSHFMNLLCKCINLQNCT